MNFNIFDNESLNEKFKLMYEQTLSMEETLDLIIKEKLSVARYGDGEIQMTTSVKGCMFEAYSPYGTAKLRTILREDHKNLLVCIPGKMRDKWWENYWKNEFKSFSEYLSPKIYGDAFISRTVFRRLGETGIDKWKSIWHNRKVVFVTGEGSRFNSDHILFDNIKENELVLSKAKRAIEDIPRLLAELSKKDKETLFLLALGPAATILAYELTLLGYQAIDIGHITNCYDSVYHKAISPEKLPIEKLPIEKELILTKNEVKKDETLIDCFNIYLNKNKKLASRVEKVKKIIKMFR